MKKFENVQEVLDFAIEREQEAHDFYEELAEKMATPQMTKVFKGFAIEELGHKIKLQALKQGEIQVDTEEVHGLKIADYVVDVKPQSDMTYADVLLVAMNREKAAFRLYCDLAELMQKNETRDIFLVLAQEEAKHKLRFEIEYDDEVLMED